MGAAFFAMAGTAMADDMFDVAFGVAVNSDYISRGITQTEHKPAVSGYIEPSIGIVYGGVWASNTEFDGVTDTEIDFYAGVRPEVGPVSLDFGYNYATSASTLSTAGAGELYAKADIAANDNTTIGAQFYVNPEDPSATYVEANADITLPHGFGVSGALGAVSNSDLPYTTWNAGIYYAPVEWAKIDLRYTATNLSASDCGTYYGANGDECDSRVMVGLSIDTSLSALKAK
ncbi:MAG: TorF family putative porin [Bauldia sp.]